MDIIILYYNLGIDYRLRSQNDEQNIGFIIGMLYLVTYMFGHALLIFLFIKKSWIFIKNNPKSNENNTIFISTSVKYINCMILPYIGTGITYILWRFFTNMVKNGKISDAEWVVYLGLSSAYQITTDMVFLHLQFDYMNKCYILLCNPFRIELHNIFGFYDNVSSLSESMISNDNIISSSNDNSDSNISESLRGVEITKSSDINSNNEYRYNDNKLRPDSSSDFEPSNSIHRPKTQIYLMNICPLI